MKHKNAEMIKAVVDNVELVIFVNAIDPEDECGNYWSVSNLATLAVASNDLFICLPQHKEACLHWLNGGHDTLECKSPFTDGFEQCYKLGSWMSGGGYMREDCEYRIKPKKEKRWIGVYTNGATTDACLLKREAQAHPMVESQSGWQFIEIEVEV